MSIYPALRYRDAHAAIAWLQEALGFEAVAVHETDGRVGHAELAFGDGMIMIGSTGVGDPQFDRGVGVVVDLPRHARRRRGVGAREGRRRRGRARARGHGIRLARVQRPRPGGERLVGGDVRPGALLSRWTSPASSTVSPPSSRRTRRPPRSAMPAPVPSPAAQTTRRPSSASRSRRASRVSSAASRDSSAASRSRQHASGAMPSVAAWQLRRQVGRVDVRVDADPEHGPALGGASLDEHSRHLAPVEQDVVRPLHARVRACDVGDREARAQRQQRIRVADHEREQQRAARRCPRAALAAAPCGLRPCGDERPVRRPAAASSRATALVEPVSRRCSRGRPSALTRAPRAARRPAGAEQRPRVTAVDGDGQRAAGVLEEQQRAGLDVGERAGQHAGGAPAAVAHRDPPADLELCALEVAVVGVEREVPVGVDRRSRGRSPRPPRPSRARAPRAPARPGRAASPRRRARRRRRAGPRRARTGRARGRWRTPAPAATARRTRRPPPRRRRSARRRAAAARCRGPTSSRSSSLVRSATARRRAPTSGSTTARWTPGAA